MVALVAVDHLRKDGVWSPRNEQYPVEATETTKNHPHHHHDDDEEARRSSSSSNDMDSSSSQGSRSSNSRSRSNDRRRRRSRDDNGATTENVVVAPIKLGDGLPHDETTKLLVSKPSSVSSSSSEESSRAYKYPSYNSLVQFFQSDGKASARADGQRKAKTKNNNDGDGDGDDDSRRVSEPHIDDDIDNEERAVWHWTILYILIPTFWLKFCQRSTIPVLPSFVQTDLHGDDRQIGLVLSAVGVGKMLGNLPSGQWIATHGPEGGLWGACLTLALAWFVATWSPTVRWLGAAGLVEGLGLALWQVARQTTVTQHVGRNQGRGRVQATTGGLERLASVVGPSFGGVLATRYNLRVPFAAKAVVMLGDATLLAVLQHVGWAQPKRRPPPQPKRRRRVASSSSEATEKNNNPVPLHPQQPTDPASMVKSTTTETTPLQPPRDELPVTSSSSSSFRDGWGAVLRNHGHDLQRIAVWAMLMPLARETRLLLFPLRAIDLGYGPHAIGILTSLTFVVDTAMFPLSGYLTDTFGRKYCGVPSGLLMALSYALAPWARDITTLTWISALGGLGNGLSGGVVTSVGSDLSPRHHRQHCALFLGTFRTISDLGILLAPLVAGTLSDRFGTTVAFAVAALVSVAAALWMALVLPETRWREQTATPTAAASNNDNPTTNTFSDRRPETAQDQQQQMVV